MWWPGLSKQLKSYIEKCPECARDAKTSKEPLIHTSLPAYPWQKVAADLFHLDGKEYILLTDYFSRFSEVKKCKSTTTQSVVNTMKMIFARYSIPEILRSDNGPKFSYQKFAQLPVQACHEHPSFPSQQWTSGKSGADSEEVAKEFRRPLSRFTLISSYSTTLVWKITSGTLGRKIRSTLPMPTSTLVREWPYVKEFQQANEKFKQQQKADYDCRHRVQDLPEIPDNTVLITTGGHPVAGRTVTMAETPRSYIVQTPTGEMRRNRSQLNIAPPTADTQTADHIPQTASRTDEEQARNPIVTRSRTGTHIAPSNRL